MAEAERPHGDRFISRRGAQENATRPDKDAHGIQDAYSLQSHNLHPSKHPVTCRNAARQPRIHTPQQAMLGASALPKTGA